MLNFPSKARKCKELPHINMLIKKGMLPYKFSVKVEWNIPVDLKHHKVYKAFEIILLPSTTRLKVSHCLLTNLGVKTCSNNYTWRFPCCNICTLITRKNSETVRQLGIGCYMQIQYTEHVRSGRQTKLTEKSILILSWLTAFASGIGSVCLMTLTLSPVINRKEQHQWQETTYS